MCKKGRPNTTIPVLMTYLSWVREILCESNRSYKVKRNGKRGWSWKDLMKGHMKWRPWMAPPMGGTGTNQSKQNELPTELSESPPKQAAQEPLIASSNSNENMDLTEKTSHLEPCEKTAEHPPALTTRTRAGRIVKKPARFKDYVTWVLEYLSRWRILVAFEHLRWRLKLLVAGVGYKHPDA